MPLGIGVPLLCCCWYHSGRLRYSLSSAANSSSRSRKPPSRASSSSRAGLTAPSRATGSRPHWLHSVGSIASKRSCVGLSHDHRRLIDNCSSAARRSGRWARTVNRRRAFTRHYLTDAGAVSLPNHLLHPTSGVARHYGGYWAQRDSRRGAGSGIDGAQDDNRRATRKGVAVPGRVEIDDVAPDVSGAPYPAKAVVDEVIPVRASVWREGHDAVAATLVVRYLGRRYPQVGEARRLKAVQAPALAEPAVDPVVKVKPLHVPMALGDEPYVFHGA